MQSSSIRASALAICTLATLTACQKDKPISQTNQPAPDRDVESAASARSASTAASAVPVGTPETIKLDSLEAAIPSLESRLAKSRLPLSSANDKQDNPSLSPLSSSSRLSSLRLTVPPPLQMPDLDGASVTSLNALPTRPAIPADTAKGILPTVPVASAVTPTAPAPVNAPEATATATPAEPQLLSLNSDFAERTTGAIQQALPSNEAPSNDAISGAAQPSAPTPASWLSDVQGHWAQNIIRTLAYAGVVQGFSDGSFRPDAPVTADQLTGMLRRAFPDGEFKADMASLPSNTTRAEAAQMVYQALVDHGKLSPLPDSMTAQLPVPRAALAPQVTASTNPKPPQEAPDSIAATSPTHPSQVESSAASTATAANPPTPPAPAEPSAAMAEALASLDAQTAPHAATVSPPAAAPTKPAASMAEALANLDAQTAPAPSTAPSKAARPDDNSLSDRVSDTKSPREQTAAEIDAAPSPAITSPAPTIAPTVDPFAQTSSSAPAPGLTSIPIDESSPDPVGDTAAAPAPASAQPASEKAARTVAVIGEVSRPGAYPLQDGANPATVTQVIEQAGGITTAANIREVQVVRGTTPENQQTLRVDLWSLLQGGDLSQDIALQPGDTIVIPKVDDRAANRGKSGSDNSAQASTSSALVQVSVVGEVNNPGQVAIQSNTSVNQVILAAGGLNNQARETADLIRLNQDGSVRRWSIALNQPEAANDPALRLRNQDVVMVRRLSSEANGSTSLESAMAPLLRILPVALPL